MELISRQAEILEQFKKIRTNFSKDPESRKTPEYLKTRLEALEHLWGEFEQNNLKLLPYEDSSEQYFTENIYQKTKDLYYDTKSKISSHSKVDKGTQPSGKVDELLSLQRTNFRAFNRIITSINVDTIEEKWELEDELRNIQSRWSIIENLHLQVDNILQGSDSFYDSEFLNYEISYKNVKRAINKKLCSSAHMQQATPQLEIPIFTGKYTLWPTFHDLYYEAIHKSSYLTKAQKMQHLKGKVRGEAERLIQHLSISEDNYDTAWDILTRRYNNPQVLFTKHIEVLLNQPNINKQTSFDIKRLHDTSMECIHAIHNLGVDTTTWDPLLVHLLSKKLDLESYAAYKEARKSPRDLPTLDEFMSFLESKFTALEPIDTKEKVSFKPSYQHPQKQASFNKPNNQYPRAPINQEKSFKRSFFQAVATNSKCPLCNQNHDLFKCKEFMNMTPEAKLSTVAKLKICKNCLYKHDSACFSSKRCKECNCDHNTILHDAYVNVSVASIPPAITSNSANKQMNYIKTHNVNCVASDDEMLLTTVQMQLLAGDGNYVTVRALLDQGSQVTLITENAVQRLGLLRRHLSASVSGIGELPSKCRGKVVLQCKSMYNDYKFVAEALIMHKVVSDLPTNSFDCKEFPHLQQIQLADPNFNVTGPIDILLNTKIYSEILMHGLVKGNEDEPIAQQTQLGWIISGRVNIKTFNCHVVVNNLADLAKYWEIEDISSTSPSMTPAEEYCEQFYQSTTTRLDNGRYEVALPMKPGFEHHLGTSRPKAIAQFKQLEQKMSNNPSFSDSYKEFMKEYIKLQHMIPATVLVAPTFYLPHHGVLKLDSTTTKLRVVFNASSKTSTGHSLNDLMECGQNLQQDLQALIMKWRQYKVVITADIEKMFRQILIRECDQHLQTIIWRNSVEEPLKSYHLTTVTYGTKAAPFLAMRTLRQLAKDDADKYPLAASALEHNFYTDDLLAGAESVEQAKALQNQLINILLGAGMNLRKWSSNKRELQQHLSSDMRDTPYEFKCAESRKTLGLQWNPSSDTFTYHNISYQLHNNTKRQMLSDISKTFDPLGWLSPLTIKAKLLFQKAWNSNASWDGELSIEIMNEWHQLGNDLQNINHLKIPRYLGNMQKTFQLHGFSDASEKAYACAIYVVTTDSKGECTSKLIAAKTKLSPLRKKVSLPRLELCGAVLLAELMKKVTDTLSVENIQVYAWTDSMVTLGWLQGDISRWKQFVANRVQQTTEIIPSFSFRHVKSEENPADCATRGMTSQQLAEHCLWWEGPKWLLTFDPKHHQTTPSTYEIPTLEAKKASVNATLQQKEASFIIQLLRDNSSLNRVARITCWVSRFIMRTRSKQNRTCKNSLTSLEINNAMNVIIKAVQSNDFGGDIRDIKTHGHVRSNSTLASLNPFIDKEGLLRVGGRLGNANISLSAKHPIILSNHSHLTKMIIQQAHLTTMHGGPRLTLSYIRDKYWITSGIRTVKGQLRKCIKCKRFSNQTHNQIMADLPHPRVTPSRPFTHTGVDYTGYVELKVNKGRGVKTTKGYVAVFVCLATKAIHLELVSDLGTPAFLAAFHRFCARRGTPQHIYSDNGTNFVGADRVLKQEYKEIIANINTDFLKDTDKMNIEWHFNAPAWPSAGGLWEAAVKSLKYHLKRVIGEQKLTYEEFTTLLHQVEACLNSRPLYALTENPDDDYLTPGHFLVGGPLLSRPLTEPETISTTTRWQLVQEMNKHFWKKWSCEYLQQLQARSKWRTASKNLKIDDVVLIKEDNLPPGKWALGRVEALHPGKDGYIRVVTLKTQNNVIKRPITKLVILPIMDTEVINQASSVADQPQDIKRENRRSHRTTKAKPLKVFICTALLMLCMLLSPSMQHETKLFNISQLNENQGLYFDKMFDLQIIRDEWKLIIYYNMSAYWQGISGIEDYLTHIRQASDRSDKHLRNIILQLQHELDEIDHYNKLLMNKYQKRQKRGLINGVGYVANTLFGVLDERFAEQYHEDIEKIVQNENHLQKLFKNQTSVLEAEFNILRRNERYMNHQFSFIKEYLTNISNEVQLGRTALQNDVYITASALSANIILTNIRRIQQTLIDTVTNIAHGRIDPHLLSPDQLSHQMSIILNQLRGDLTLPVGESDIKDLYQLLKVSVRIMNSYLIIEIRIPLLSNDLYELDKIISLPQKRGKDNYVILPFTPYIAFNLRKDMIILLTDSDLQICVHISAEKLLCSLVKPIYSLQLKQSPCDIKLTSSADLSPCTTKQSPCADLWIKLRRPNVWLYSCCEKCHVRIICVADIKSMTLQGNGVIDISQGCILKGNTFTIHAHNNFLNHMNIQQKVEIPEISILNSVINTSLPVNMSVENHQHVWEHLGAQIANIKEQSTLEQISRHDIHHYTLLYTIITFIFVVGGIYIIMKIRTRNQDRMEPPPDRQQVTGVSIASVNSVSEMSERSDVKSANKGTSPINVRSLRFNSEVCNI